MSKITTLFISDGREYIYCVGNDRFHKTIGDLKNIEMKLDSEDKIILLLSSLPRSFENFKEVLLYRK